MKVLRLACINSILLLYSSGILAQDGATTLTDSLVNQFNQAWNRGDIKAMTGMLDSSAFFRSPYQLQYGRDTMAATVLQTNPSKFKITSHIETYSRIVDGLAWSIGHFTLAVFENGEKASQEPQKGDYIYVFRLTGQKWKLQMMIIHE